MEMANPVYRVINLQWLRSEALKNHRRYEVDLVKYKSQVDEYKSH